MLVRFYCTRNLLFALPLWSCLIIPVFLIGQADDCLRISKDTGKCYAYRKYVPPKIILEKKWTCLDTSSPSVVPLIADIDGDCIPEIIHKGQARYHYARLPDTFRVHIFNSLNGKFKKKFDVYSYDGDNSMPVLVDVDNDGMIEIIIPTSSGYTAGQLICYDINGNLRWISNDFFHGGGLQVGGPNLGVADFNQDGIPEVYTNNRIFNAQTGKLLAKGVGGVGSNYTIAAVTHQVCIAAQLDDNPSDLELAAGYTIYKVKINNKNGSAGNVMTPINIVVDNQYLDGKTAVADINLDGKLDVIVSYGDAEPRSKLYAYSIINGIPVLLTENIVKGLDNPNGCPSIGDIDGNGIPNILVTKFHSIHNYEYNGTSSLNLKWSLMLKDTVAYTGMTLFDLNGDGTQEIIYRDMEFLYIIDGSINPPQIIDSYPCLAMTLSEYPVVADIDNTGQAKICTYCAFPEDRYRAYGKLIVFGSPDSLPGWAPARGIWNQYAYNPLYINDDLTVPQYPKQQATYQNGKYNNFLQQESLLDSNGMYKVASASLLGAIQCVQFDTSAGEFVAHFDVINKQEATRSSGKPLVVSFYDGDPQTNGALVDSVVIQREVQPGDTLRDVVFRFNNTNVRQLYMVVNTSRAGNGLFVDSDFNQLECDYTDNISLFMDLPSFDTLLASICANDSFLFHNTPLHLPGRYFHFQKNKNHCDSLIHILHLSVSDSIAVEANATACDSLWWNGMRLTADGQYVHRSTSAGGCDSVQILHLSIYPSIFQSFGVHSCKEYVWQGRRLDKSGTYTEALKTAQGCDSTLQLHLTIHAPDTVYEKIAACNAYQWNGNTYTRSGSYTHTALNRQGCDSVTTLHLTIDTAIAIDLQAQSCESYLFHGNILDSSGTYVYRSTSQHGCDSSTTLHLTIHRPDTVIQQAQACDSYAWNGRHLTQSGRYFYTAQNRHGCDSTVLLELEISRTSSSYDTVHSCVPYQWQNQNLKNSGDYFYKGINHSGCDSNMYLHLIIHRSDTSFISQTACDRYEWNGHTYTQSGVYSTLMSNAAGCDSLVQLHLVILASSDSVLHLSACDSAVVFGDTLRESGTFRLKGSNAAGCDSVIRLHLNIARAESIVEESACHAYTWPVNGKTYLQSGVYTETFKNQAGCDSTITLRLTLHPSYHEEIGVAACDAFYWPLSDSIYHLSGQYKVVVRSSQNCDSVIQLNLRVGTTSFQSDTVRSTRNYIWPVNAKRYDKSGVYRQRFTKDDLCDSIRELVLYIVNDVGIYTPNVISPHSLNRGFTVYDNGATIGQIISLSIFDRWGELIWQGARLRPNRPDEGWQGWNKDAYAMPGVYVWVAELKLLDGTEIRLHGDVTVAR